MLIDRREYKTFCFEKVIGIGDIAQGRVSFSCNAPDLNNIQDLVFNIQIATSLIKKVVLCQYSKCHGYKQNNPQKTYWSSNDGSEFFHKLATANFPDKLLSAVLNARIYKLYILKQ